MVEPTNEPQTPPQELIDRVNLEQLVHNKAYQTGYFTFDKKFTTTRGFFGSKRTLELYDETSSFLPFLPRDRAVLLSSDEPFVDLPRPYREGY